mmetsp:Transcript_9930/g.23239  ORF Transcript_9930/g.23239 Transcript_9930/m.23239 type:complete len:189 (-) Transcript_9930:236-802(-)
MTFAPSFHLSNSESKSHTSVLYNFEVPFKMHVNLGPPRLAFRTEVGLCPWAEDDLIGFVDIKVSKSKRKRSGSTDNGSSGCVLRSVARAHELVVGGRPRDNTSQVSADGVQAIVLKRSVFLNDKVCGISLQSLGQTVVSGLLLGEVRLRENLVTEGILSRTSATSSTRAWGEEEEDVRNSQATNCNSR